MLESLFPNPVIDMLKDDHDRVKKLFDNFKMTRARPAKTKIVSQALTELKIHAVLEEELFYPAVRNQVGAVLMNEAQEEHHVAKVLIAELDQMKSGSGSYDAKFNVLSENVRHHITEEEDEIFPKARDLKIDFDRLAGAMIARREELLANGIPPMQEEEMVTIARQAPPKRTAARKKAAKPATAKAASSRTGQKKKPMVKHA